MIGILWFVALAFWAVQRIYNFGAELEHRSVVQKTRDRDAVQVAVMICEPSKVYACPECRTAIPAEKEKEKGQGQGLFSP